MSDAATDYLRRWLVDPDGGGSFARQRDAIAVHDPGCGSLQYAWLPRRRGASCPSDLSVCDGGCGVMFFNEGVQSACWDCDDPQDFFCACCRGKQARCGCHVEAGGRE